MTSMIKANGNLLAFFERPVSAVLGVVTLVVWGWILLAQLRSMRRSTRPPHDPALIR